MKNFLKKHPSVAILLALTALLLTQYKVVMPLVYKVVSSDLFMVDSNDKPSQLPISSSMTDLAFMFCNKQINSDNKTNQSITFPSKPINAWSFGNYQYLINSDYTIADSASGQPLVKKYACRITYKNGDNLTGNDNFDNWSIEGISGVEDLDK